MAYNSSDALFWAAQGNDPMAKSCEEKRLRARGCIPKSPKSTFHDVRLFAFSPDTSRVRVRAECAQHKPFWVEVSFLFGPTVGNMQFQAYGHVENVQGVSNGSTLRLDTPYIVNVTSEEFTLRVECAEVSAFWMEITIPLAKLCHFVASERVRIKR